MSLRQKALLIQLGFVVALALAWQAATRFGGVDPMVLPALSDVLATLWLLKEDPLFQRHAATTAMRVVAAFCIGAPLAIVFGFAVAEHVSLQRRLSPALNFLLAVPQSMLLPLFILSFGVGDAQKIVFGITHIFFVLAMTTIAAVNSVPRNYAVAARSYGARPAQIYREVYLPSVLPLLVAGMRTAMIFNVVGILLAEMYASQSGLGLLMMQWGEAYKVKELLATIVLLSLATIAFNEAMRMWESRLGIGTVHSRAK